VKAFTCFIPVVTIDENFSRFHTKNIKVTCVPGYRELHLTTRKLNSSILAKTADDYLFKYIFQSVMKCNTEISSLK
jgi:hypothetical protein